MCDCVWLIAYVCLLFVCLLCDYSSPLSVCCKVVGCACHALLSAYMRTTHFITYAVYFVRVVTTCLARTLTTHRHLTLHHVSGST